MVADLTLASKVQLSNDVLFQELQGESVLLNLKSGVYLGLDPVGTRIWKLLEKHSLLSEVLACMLSEYDVTEERCGNDLLDLVTKMRDQGLVVVI